MKNNGSEIFDELIKLLLKKKMKISAAESCTGGLFMSMITEIPGSSAVFTEGFVTYSNESKFNRLGVNPYTLGIKGAVSEETVSEMLDGLLSETQAGVVCAVSGIAGPGGGTKEKPVGTVVLGFCIRGDKKVIRKMLFEGGRHKIRIHACCELAAMITGKLRETSHE
jgi:PncC family amidohydrolase